MPSTSSFSPIESESSLVIAAAGTVSAAVDLMGVRACGLITPSSLVGTSVTFQVSRDNSTFVPLYTDDNVQYTITVAVSRAYALDPMVFAAWRYIKIVSGSAETNGATFYLITRPL